ncbi:MAG: McrC family protein [candidate division WOR-3 bacterium]|uniref:Uncharacterized protein n=1 Tax=candidate division WOR-3 bacterium TaxID=2052148 RepID=A0A7C1NC38_UNCW3|nr:McrC family protein [candidate division WOR-3 bacterium]
MKKLQLQLTEFNQPKTVTIETLKNWFPSGKFDKRMPWDCVNKWIATNKKYLDFLHVQYTWDNNTGLSFEPSDLVGIAPLKNPYNQEVYGTIIVKPRIKLNTLSEILESIDWKLEPEFWESEEPIMHHGMLPRWVKAVATLRAIEKALSPPLRGMQKIYETKNSPVGTVDWYNYALTKIPTGNWDRFKTQCTDYTIDLDIHRQFKGIINLIEIDVSTTNVPVKIKKDALPSIHKLKKTLFNVTLEAPEIDKLKKAQIPPFYQATYERARQQGISYLKQSRISLSSAQFWGFPWKIEMSKLFEFWVEHVCYRFAKLIGANFYSDIRKNAKLRLIPFTRWSGLRELKPDIIIDKENLVMIIDVKYKKHLLYLRSGNSTPEIEEEHRKDVHQVLAYAGLSPNIDKRAVLIYPRLSNEIIIEKAEVVSYKNTKGNMMLFKIDVPFDEEELLTLLHRIWNSDFN